MTEDKELNYPNNRQSWGIVGIIILATLLFSPISIVLNPIAGKEFSFLTTYLLSMGVPFFIVHELRKKQTGVSGYTFDSCSPKVLILISLAVLGIQTGIISPLVSLIPLPEFMRTIFLELAKSTGFFSFIAIVIAAPILEELIFRGIMLDGLLKKYSPLKAIIISSVLFGVVHLNPWQFISAFTLGTFAGWVYYKTKNLTLSILIHLVNNLFAFGSTYFIDAEAMIDMPLSEFYGGYMNFFLIIIGALVIAASSLYMLRFELTSTEEGSDNTITDHEGRNH